jgi:very-short-patch-repair endonuclease
MKTAQARVLRKRSTPAERKLWSRLRNRQLIGMKFRRQQPVGDRIADFLCEEAALAIELDGSGHHRHFNQAADLDKELEFHENGIRIIRFENSVVMTDIDSVLNQIIYAIDPEKSLWAEPKKSEAGAPVTKRRRRPSP